MAHHDVFSQRQERKDADPTIQINHAHVVAEDHTLETNVQPRMLYVTGANERDILCHAALPNQFPDFHKKVI